MGLYSDLSGQVDTFFSEKWETEDARCVPESESLRLSNHAKKLDAVVLYADLADSTRLVDAHRPEYVTRIYKAYLHCAAQIIKNNSGTITAYDGDRVMAVYIGKNKETNAVITAMKLNFMVGEVFNKKYKLKLRHVVGIDKSDLFASKIGVRGDNDVVWIGRAANYAAKLSSCSDAYSCYITGSVFAAMDEKLKVSEKNIWTDEIWTPYSDAAPIVRYHTNALIRFS
ncbi:adenylate/guanylate cyclase domain-containing protein [Acidithiobacillus ferrooxidans]|uniref:adenylate/guanylate cyclase domain-containing protein n=1 Tax=Acidithiobacillus ferrooxidans TaxID=920 RepID=UPI001C073D0C|nr:adenylate/guanylate cyclase domain-containing protein [Acidithiobacillus ferrooxidans]MBU2772627.1 adenylate/guanylate cyclase domain-containing protein [Acidithiobacillus ferrooxidans]